MWGWLSLGVLAALLWTGLLLRWRWHMLRARTQARECDLARGGEQSLRCFDPLMTADLPEPVQRFFAYCLSPGASLHSRAVLKMQGDFRFQKNTPWLPLQATQTLAAPTGMVWSARIGAGWQTMCGSDGVFAESSWTQFSWRDQLPLVHVHDNPDHYRSAVGRMLAEAVFWTPGALLTRLPVRWLALDGNTIQATLQHGSVEVCARIVLGADGQALSLQFERWSDANDEREYRLQPFGGMLSHYRDFQGIRIPTQVEAGNFFGTDDYFPFYRVQIQSLQWCDAQS
ncbi:MAG: hypothetical protein H7A05_11390 [Pseudomonadales bacterium]|nr:hypothetical protein [Pseudomonadales bacterium]